MKTLFIIIWFLVTVRVDYNKPTKKIICNSSIQVDSILSMYGFDIKTDSVFKYSNFLEIRKTKLHIYIEQKNEKEK